MSHDEPSYKCRPSKRRENLNCVPRDHALRYSQIEIAPLTRNASSATIIRPRGYRARAHFGSADGGDWSDNGRYYN